MGNSNACPCSANANQLFEEPVAVDLCGEVLLLMIVVPC